MVNLNEQQLAQLVCHYIREYQEEEIIPMIFEAVIIQNTKTLTLIWDNLASDVFRKIRIYYDGGENYVDVLKIVED
jgi:hypothetical protein